MVAEVQLLAIRDGVYTMYVFKDLNTGEFIMCTKPPNWESPNITPGEEGFIKYETVEAGQSYYDPTTDTHIKYKYTNTYFTNFVKKSEITKENNIIL